jgi:hypothetical protein
MIPPDLPIIFYLPIMLAIVSLVYSATRFEEWRNILPFAAVNGVKLLLMMMGIHLFLVFLSMKYDGRIYLIVTGLLLIYLFAPARLWSFMLERWKKFLGINVPTKPST